MQSLRIFKILDVVICWSFCLMVFFVPLVYSSEVFLSFELVKVSFFRFFVIWIAMLMLLNFCLGGGKCGWSKISKWFYVFFGGYLVCFVFSIVFSLSPYISFWGSYERQQGVLQLMFYWLFFGESFLYFSQRGGRIQMTIKTALMGAVVVSIWAILQAIFPMLADFWQVEELLGRQASTLGHPNFLATYLVMMMPLFFVVGGRWWRYLMVFALAALVLTGSRAGILALLIEAVLMIIPLFKGKGNEKKELSGGSSSGGDVRFFCGGEGFKKYIVLSTIILIAAGVFVGRTFLNENPWRSIQSRIIVWQESVRMILDKPLFGHGPEMYREAFMPYMRSELLELEKFNTVPDRAHNQLLDLAVEIGVFGMIFYLMLWAFFAVKALRSKDLLVRAMGVGLVGLFTANLFGFSVTVHQVFFWLFAGMIMGCGEVRLGASGLNAILTGRKHLQKFLYVFALAVLLMIFVLFRMVVRDFLADVSYKSGVVAVAKDNKFQAIDYFKKAVELNPRQSEYYFKAVEYALLEAGYTSGLERSELLKSAEWFLKGVEDMVGANLYEVLYLKAVLEWRMGDFRLADQVFEELYEGVKFVPKYILAWARMLKESDEAEKALEKYNLYFLLVPEVDRLFLKHNPEFNDVLKEMDELR